MTNLFIKNTEFTPLINFNTTENKFIISGESRPENTKLFYTPVLDWVINYYNLLYFQHEGSKNKTLPIIVFEFQLDYFNSTSAKFLFDILQQLNKINKEITPINIKWIFDKQDVDMKEAGQEFCNLLDIPFLFEAI
ncbi:MAG: DUF1987 domain-containing protein [Bacteroidetes bacterium]|nr:DUF1987 domain-containing protein [Bacteroidota bacterium]